MGTVLNSPKSIWSGDKGVLSRLKTVWSCHKRLFRAGIGLALAALAIYLLVLKDKEAITAEKVRALADNPQWLLIGVVMIFVANILAVPRWQILLRAQGIHMPFWEAFRLTFVGYFFNFIVPGGTGGDVVKAYYATKYTPKKAEAVTTVFLDRVIGIYALAFMAACAVALKFRTLWSDPGSRVRTVLDWQTTDSQLLVLTVLAVFAIGTIAFFILFSGILKRSGTLVAIAKRLPGHTILRKVHYALVIYKNEKLAVFNVFALSVLLQSISVFGHWCFGLALGMHYNEVSVGNYFFLVPIGLMVNGLPLTPMGLGVGEGAFQLLFRIVKNENGAMIVALFHFAQLLTGALGLVYYIQGRQNYAAIMERADVELEEAR